MTKSIDPVLLEKLRRLQTDLTDLAFTLDLRGRAEAADLAVTIGERIGALCQEFAPPHLTEPEFTSPSASPRATSATQSRLIGTSRISKTSGRYGCLTQQ
jgi:hypothetical protein